MQIGRRYVSTNHNRTLISDHFACIHERALSRRCTDGERIALRPDEIEKIHIFFGRLAITFHLPLGNQLYRLSFAAVRNCSPPPPPPPPTFLR